MSDRRDVESDDESEFGIGAGLIDSVSRAERNITAEDELREIYARPKTFNDGVTERPTLDTTPVPRLLPGEEIGDRD